MTKRVKIGITINPAVRKMIEKKAVEEDVSKGILIEFGMMYFVKQLQYGDNKKRLKEYNETIKKQRSDERKFRQRKQ